MTISNPYLDAAKAANFTDWDIKWPLIRRYSFAIPNQEAINTIAQIAKFYPILEIGSGTGYWAYLLRRHGVDIRATDNHKPLNNPYKFNHVHTHVERIEASAAICKYQRDLKESRAILLCWPPYDDYLAYDVLLSNPKILIYVGESREGRTANDAFFKRLRRRYRWLNTIRIPQWYGLHDSLQIYKRR